MSTPSSPGWYENPDNPDELRYFDGILWTANTTPLRTRQPKPPVVVPPSADGKPAPRPEGWGPQPHQQTGPMTAMQGVSGEPTLASYGSRVGAFLLDMLVLYAATFALGGWFLWQAIEPVMDRINDAIADNDVTAMSAALADARLGQLLAFFAIQLLLFVAYQTFCLAKWGATPGKLVVGISVRRLDRPGPLDAETAIRRVGFQAMTQALGNVPVLSIVGMMLTIADLIWPFADAKKQALHDKVAKTIVIKGRAQR